MLFFIEKVAKILFKIVCFLDFWNVILPKNILVKVFFVFIYSNSIFTLSFFTKISGSTKLTFSRFFFLVQFVTNYKLKKLYFSVFGIQKCIITPIINWYTGKFAKNLNYSISWKYNQKLNYYPWNRNFDNYITI